jgi:CDP-glucose 4,6-dehydratase
MSLQLDCTKAIRHLHWRSIIGFAETMQLTAEWYKDQATKGDGSMREFSIQQLRNFEQRLNREILI